MYLLYADLVHFTTSPTFGNPYEAKLTERVLNWVGKAQDIIDSSYYFTVDYIYSEWGVAVGAEIKVQKKTNDVWETIGVFSPDGATLSSIIEVAVCEQPCVPSDIISDPIHYYIPSYYETGYYV